MSVAKLPTEDDEGTNKKMNFYKDNGIYHAYIFNRGSDLGGESTVSYRDAAHKAIDLFMDYVEPESRA